MTFQSVSSCGARTGCCSIFQGQNYKLDVNFAGIMTSDSGWAASWNDRAAPVPNSVPEPTTLALLGVGMLGLAGANRRNKQS